TKRIWGGRFALTGSSGTGQAACGIEISSCPIDITAHPTAAGVCAGGNTSFNIAATGTTGVQWQLSSNGGTTWSNVTNGGVYSGATTNTLSITGAPVSLDNNLYRCIANNTTNSC